MKRRNRVGNHVLALAVSLLLTGLLFTGCSGKKPQESETKETVELIVRTPPLIYGNLGGGNAQSEAYTDFLDYAAGKFSAQYRQADVKITVEGFDYLDEARAVTENFDTPKAADVLFEGFFNMGSYIHTGRMAPLDDIIDDAARSDISEAMWEEGVYQDKSYMYPFYHLPNALTYNAEMFRQAGLERFIVEEDEIANWSMDDWETILDTLAQKLPTSSFPMMMYAKNNQGDTHIMVLLRAFGCSFFDEDGRFTVDTPEGIKALKWIQDGVSKGWFPSAAENLEIVDCVQLFNNGQLAVCMANPASRTLFEEAKLDVRWANFPSVNGSGLSTTFVTGFGVFDNGDEQKVAAAKAFVKFVCEDEELSKATLPNIPVRASMQKLYKDQIPMLDAYAANESTLVNFTGNLPNWAGVRAVFYPQIHGLLVGDLTPEQAAAAIDKECNAAVKGGK